MSIGIGQILVILLVVLIAFGKFPEIFHNIASGIKTVRNAVEDNENKLEEGKQKKKDGAEQ